MVKIAFSVRYKGEIEDFSQKKGPARCFVSSRDCCGLSVIFCGFISHLIGRETINIPEILSGVHGFTEKSVRSSSIVWKITSLTSRENTQILSADVISSGRHSERRNPQGHLFWPGVPTFAGCPRI